MLRCSVTYLELLQTEDNTKYACIFLLLRCSVTYLELLQTEDNTKYACIFLLLRRSVTYSELLQTEDNTKQARLFLWCPQLILVFLAASEAVKCVETNVFSLIDEKSKPKIWRYELKSVTLHPLIKQSGIVIHCDCKATSIAFPLLERWQSGRMHRS